MGELDKGGLEGCDWDQLDTKSAKRVLVGLGGRILFYPTLLYNVLRNQIQSEFRWWDEVDQYLLLGAVPFQKDVLRLQNLGVKGVVTLNEPYETLVPSSLYKAHGIDHLMIPTRDYLFAPSLVDISRAVDFIHRNASHGSTTYVHCKAGRGRSTTIVLCYLIEYKNMTPADALEYVRSRRPRVLLAPSQWQFKSSEITGIVNDFNEPGSLAPTGLHLGGTKYMVIQGEPGAVIRGKKGPGGITVKKTNQAMIFGIYDEPMTPGQCNMVVERLGDYLIEQGL